jgi:predicted transcriptional regulator
MSTNDDRSTVLLSVRPRFANGLLDGTKTVEIRRGRAHIEPGATCLLYSSSPERALVGVVEVDNAHVGTPSTLWNRWGKLTGLARCEFDDYLRGRHEATAIVIRSARRLSAPVPLDELRGRQDGFVTPQSYRFLAEQERRALLA